VPPVRGDIYADSILDWLAYNGALAEGRATFMVYVDSIAGERVSAILKNLQNKGYMNVSLIFWDLAPQSNPSLFAAFREFEGSRVMRLNMNSQMLAINDCMFRMIGVADWVGIFDLDEYIVGRCKEASTLTNMFGLSGGEESVAAGYMFQSAFFDGTCKNTTTVSRYPFDSTAFRRRWLPPGTRSKMFVDPRFTYVQGIHHTHSSVNQHRGVQDQRLLAAPRMPACVVVPKKVGALHHYRYLPKEKRNVRECVVSDDLFLDTSAFNETPECRTVASHNNGLFCLQPFSYNSLSVPSTNGRGF
jgi:hypothetical protein